MLTEEQEQIIIQYLLQKKLSLDIASEVFDHMSSQVIHLQHEGNLSFEEAWMQTKSSWLQDLKMTYDVRYSFDDITEIMKTVTKKRWKQDVKKVLPIVLGFIFLLNLIFVNLPAEGINYFRIFFSVFYVIFVITAIILARKYNAAIKKYNNNQMLSGENWYAIVACSAGLVTLIFRMDSWESFYKAFQAALSLQWEASVIFTILYFNLIMVFFSMIVVHNFHYHKRLKKTLAQIKPFLEKIK